MLRIAQMKFHELRSQGEGSIFRRLFGRYIKRKRIRGHFWKGRCLVFLALISGPRAGTQQEDTDDQEGQMFHVGSLLASPLLRVGEVADGASKYRIFSFIHNTSAKNSRITEKRESPVHHERPGLSLVHLRMVGMLDFSFVSGGNTLRNRLIQDHQYAENADRESPMVSDWPCKQQQSKANASGPTIPLLFD